MGISSAVIGGIGALGGLFGGGKASDVPMPPQFNMPNMGQAANNAFSGIGNLQPFTDLGTSSLGPAQQTFSNLYNNPFAGPAQAGANVASGMGMQGATNAFGLGGQLAGFGAGMLPGAQTIMNTGFDPQGALYGRTLQQVQDQTNANNAMSGVGGTPYGAGVANQATNNFNIDWQNNQLGRQATAANAAGGLLGAGGNAINMGTGIQNTAPGQFAQAAAMPYATFGGIGGNQNQALQSLLGIGGSGQGLANQQIQDYLAYIGAGNQAGQVANQNSALQLAQQQQQFAQNQAFGGMLGKSMYGLGQGFGGSPFANMNFSGFGGGTMGTASSPYALMGGAGPFSPSGFG